MKVALIGVAMGLALLGSPAAQAEPGYGSDCILTGVSECRLMPDAEGPHNVEVYCPGQGWINVFEPCDNRFGPYSPYQ